MSANPGTFVFHIGQHKTGSKALQSFCSHNRRALRGAGLHYPAECQARHDIRAYSISHFRLFALVRRESIRQCLGTAATDAFWAANRAYCEPFDSAESLLRDAESERRRSGLSRVILSAEDLFDMHSAHEIGFAPELVDAGAQLLAGLVSSLGLRARVVVYLRRQDHLLASHYVQFIKGSDSHDVGFDEFARAFAPRLDSRDILSRWVAAFGPERVTVRAYEPTALPGGIVPDFFEQALGLPVPEGCSSPPADAEAVNRTLNRDFVEFTRIMNRRNVEGKSTFRRDLLLDVALRPPTTADAPSGIAEWLSPVERRRLLASHSDGNAAIASDLMGRDDARLFAENPPEADESWSPYPGLSPETATAISLAIHEASPPKEPAIVPDERPAGPLRRLRSIMARKAS